MQAAIPVGACARSVQLRLPSVPVLSDRDFVFPRDTDLTYSATPNGVLVTFDQRPVAWLFKGHAGSRTAARRCEFWDVAFPTLTLGEQGRITGLMLDSTSFDTLAEAVQFVQATFGGAA